MDFKLDPVTHDLVLDQNGNPETVKGPEEAAQAVKVLWLTQQGEWVFDLSYGIPWLEAMQTRPPDLGALRGVMIAKTLAVPGVDEVIELELTENSDRTLSVSGKIVASGITLSVEV